MRYASLFALFALVPVAINATTSTPHRRLEIAICTGNGTARTVPFPASPDGNEHTCPKGCHSGCSRKREVRRA